SSSRVLVQQGIADKFIEKLTARVKALKVGHPLDPATEIGPLIHERHLAKVCSYFEVAQKDGATIAVGGKPYDGPGGGHYVQPTLVTGATSKMRVAQEEVFGPFLTVIPFEDEKDAIEIANGVQYGLTGYVWTGDMARAQAPVSKDGPWATWFETALARLLTMRVNDKSGSEKIDACSDTHFRPAVQYHPLQPCGARCRRPQKEPLILRDHRGPPCRGR